MLGLFIFVHFGHQTIQAFYEKARVSHRLSVQALLLSEENFHTQLEIYEVVSKPNAKRIADFYSHEKLFLKELDELYLALAQNQTDVSADVAKRINALREAIPRIQSHWDKILLAVEKKRPMPELIELLLKAEDAFDEEQFNLRIKEIVNLQLSEVERSEKEVRDMNRATRIVVMVGIVLALILTSMVTLLHRAALRGKADQLHMVQAGKLASLGQLSAGMAHELNSPLMFIQGYNNRVRSTLKKASFDLQSPVWDSIQEVESGVERITKIVKHFRDFARISNNEMKAISVNQAITRSFTLFEEQLRLNQIKVELRLSTLDPLILADANRIEQVMLNFISNARDALGGKQDANDKFIEVSTYATQYFVTIQFSDTGSGIAKDNLPRIFDPFFTTKPVGLGTGLGLSISAGIIRDHSGKIEVDSTLGEGTTFVLTFPRAEIEKQTG